MATTTTRTDKPAAIATKKAVRKPAAKQSEKPEPVVKTGPARDPKSANKAISTPDNGADTPASSERFVSSEQPNMLRLGRFMSLKQDTDRNRAKVTDLRAYPLTTGSVVTPALVFEDTDAFERGLKAKADVPLDLRNNIIFLGLDTRSNGLEWLVGTKGASLIVLRVYESGVLKFRSVGQAEFEKNYGLGTAFDAEGFEYWQTEEAFQRMEAEREKANAAAREAGKARRAEKKAAEKAAEIQSDEQEVKPAPKAGPKARKAAKESTAKESSGAKVVQISKPRNKK